MDHAPGLGALPRLAQNRLPALLLVLAGMVFVVGPSVTDGRIPGDLGDARFNSYVLEHFHRWITHQDQRFWNADFFYPFPLTIAFSDNHLGDGPIYSLFRALGFDREDGFRLWFGMGFAINFAAAAYSLVRLGYSRLAAALGAFLFAFGLPMMAQENHAQLVYRFGVPLAVLALVEFRRRKQLWQLGLAAFWTTWQFYCSIYIGYFLVLLLVALVLGLAACREGGARAGIRRLPSEAFQVWSRRPVWARIAFLLSMTVLAGLLALLFAPYVEASLLYGFRRSWSEIALMLPRPASYLLATNSRIWPSSGWPFDALPMRHEHAMFIGVAPYLAIATAMILRLTKRAAPDGLFVPVAIAIMLLVLLTLNIHGFSLYLLPALAPGSDAVRAVTRIGTVMLFPIGVLLASSLDGIMTARLPVWARSGAVALVASLLVFEACFIVHNTASKHDWQARMAAIAAELPPALPEAPILLIGPVQGEPLYQPELDAMLFAQDRGWRTINGYSGNLPPEHKVSGLCTDAPRDLAGGLDFLGLTSEQYYAALASRVVAIHYPPCDETARPRRAGARGLPSSGS